MVYGTSSVSFLVTGSSKRRPIRRLTAKTVLSGLVTAWRLAGWPIRRSPSLVKATIDGVVRAPSEFSMTLGFAPSMTATQLLVVPRSMPITFAIVFCPFLRLLRRRVGAAPRTGQAALSGSDRRDIGALRLGTRAADG